MVAYQLSKAFRFSIRVIPPAGSVWYVRTAGVLKATLFQTPAASERVWTLAGGQANCGGQQTRSRVDRATVGSDEPALRMP
jgi:ribosomal protein S19E (S16A)